MIGQEPRFENKETAEQTLARQLKEKGIDDPETKSLLLAWTLGQEQIVKESEDACEAAILLNVRRARLYFEAGYLEEAFENFDQAAYQAECEQRTELRQAIIEEMDRLEKLLK